jgi:pilus assembly protein CpaE
MSKDQLGDNQPEDYGAAVRDRPVPRISIQAFCESPDTGSVLQRAAMDRRLAKAHVTVHMGGIIAAAEHFTETPTPNLVIVECREKGKVVLERLEQLAQVCDPGSKVIVIGVDNDITLYRELIRAGVNEYIVAPFGPLTIIESIAALYVGPEAGPIGRIFAFVPAKGGVGSSTIAHNVAWCVAEQMKINTAVADLDLAFGTAGLDFNQDPVQGIADALLSPERLDDVLLDRLLVKYTERLSLLTAPATIERDYEVDTDAYDAVLDLVRASVPCVVIDLPHVWTPWAKQIMCSADEVVITASPDLASLRNTKNIFELVKQARPNDNPARLVLNQVGIVKRPEIPAKDFGDAVGSPPALVLPFDPQLFGTAANNGQMIAECSPQSRAAQGFSQLAQQLIGREVPIETKQKTSPFLEFLKGKKKAS